MEGKINRLKSILIIGTIILFLAGISFLFVKSVDNYMKTITMGLISGVLVYLSYYEDKTLNFKGSSLTTYVFSMIGFLFTYISTGFFGLFGKWFSVLGEGDIVFFGTIFFVAALLILISAVKYKVYKLIELSIWLTIIGISFIIAHFDVDGKYIMVTLLSLALIKNVVNFNNYSRWLTFVISLISILCIDDKVAIPSLIISALVVVNSLFILFKNDKVQILPIIISYLTIFITGIVFKNVLVSVSVMAVLELVFSYTKVIKNKEVAIVSKIVINLAYLLSLPSAAENEIFKYVVPGIIFGTSLINVLVFKDETEEYLLPFKVLYFTIVELNYLPIDVFKEYLIVFVSNIVVLLMYFLSKKNGVKNVNLVLLALINMFTVLRMSKAVFPNIVYLVLFALDFYIVYVNEEKGKIPLSVVFILYSVFLFLSKMSYLDATFALAVAVFYFVFLLITRKNKIVFGTSILGFIAATIVYLNSLISDQSLLMLIGDFLFLGGVILFEKVIVERPSNKAALYGVLISLQILVNAFSGLNVVLKIFALLEGIGLIALSIKDDKYKGLYIDGLIFVVITLFCIVNSIASLPKTMYLILIGLTIVVITPLIINKYVKLNAELKIKEEEERKKREEELKKLQKNKKYKLNFCPDCGTEVKDTYTFCSKCGRKIR